MSALPLRVLVSADSNQQHFIDCIKQICEDSSGEYEFHFLPDEVATANEKDRLNRMINYVEYADLIIMDVTPHTFPTEENKYRYMTNQGVLIEYGAVIAKEHKKWRLKLFCEDTIDRRNLHSYILKTVDTYNRKDLDSLRKKVKHVIEKLKHEIFERQRIQERQLQAFKTILSK